MKQEAGQIKLEIHGEEIAITQAGFSCLVDSFIPPFTEMTVTISLPDEGMGQSEISCRGAVVSCSPLGDGRYRLLLYFLDMDEEASRELASYCSSSRI